MNDRTATWLGYPFSIHTIDSNWNEVPGLYIFAGIDSQSNWRPFYIGRTDSLAGRIPNHEQWQAASRLGATHVHATVIQEVARRSFIEERLIQAYRPYLNIQHSS